MKEKIKNHILAVIQPREDLPRLEQLETRMLQNPNNQQHKEDFIDVLKKSCISEFLQIRDIKIDSQTQKRMLEVVRVCQPKPAASGPAREDAANLEV